MKSNEFTLINIAGGSGGTYRIHDGRLTERAIRAIQDAPHGGWEFRGPAAAEAAQLWEDHLESRED